MIRVNFIGAIMILAMLTAILLTSGLLRLFALDKSIAKSIALSIACIVFFIIDLVYRLIISNEEDTFFKKLILSRNGGTFICPVWAFSALSFMLNILGLLD